MKTTLRSISIIFFADSWWFWIQVVLLYRWSLYTGGPYIQVVLLYRQSLCTRWSFCTDFTVLMSIVNFFQPSLGACAGEGESIARVYEDDGTEILLTLLFMDLQAVPLLDDFSPCSHLPYQGLKAAHSTSSVYVCW